MSSRIGEEARKIKVFFEDFSIKVVEILVIIFSESNPYAECS